MILKINYVKSTQRIDMYIGLFEAETFVHGSKIHFNS